MISLEDSKKFEMNKISKKNLSGISGGDDGRETDTCKGTTKVLPVGGIPDTYEDGDWYSTC